MIHIIDQHNIEAYRPYMEQAFRLRHKVFVEEKGWKALERADHRDIDQFDDENAVYHLYIDDMGQVLGCQRMLPSTRPHLLSHVLPTLCDGVRPVGDHIWEWTRYAVAPEARRGGKMLSPIALALLAGIVEWGMQRNINTIIIQMNQHWLLRLLQLRFKTIPLGFPQDIEGETTIAVTAEFNASTLAKLREVSGVAEPIAIYRPRPAIPVAA